MPTKRAGDDAMAKAAGARALARAVQRTCDCPLPGFGKSVACGNALAARGAGALTVEHGQLACRCGCHGAAADKREVRRPLDQREGDRRS